MRFWPKEDCAEGVHDFRPRYDEVWPAWFQNVTKISGDCEHYKERRYVQDVCVRCGIATTRAKAE